MSPELDQAIFAAFPDLYRDRAVSTNQMKWGFTHSDGWFQIAYTMSEGISEHAAATASIRPKGLQVKEKFGVLAAYFHDTDDFVRGVISLAPRQPPKSTARSAVRQARFATRDGCARSAAHTGAMKYSPTTILTPRKRRSPNGLIEQRKPSLRLMKPADRTSCAALRYAPTQAGP